MSKKMSARREFLSDEIGTTRKQLIALELEEKFAKEHLSKIAKKECETPQDLEFKKNTEHFLNNVEHSRAYLIDRLNFFKQEREKESNKKALKFYAKCPKKISTNDLVEEKNA